jgi:hypothetical protein
VTELFQHVKGGFTIYAGGSDVEIPDVRFALANFGEDAAKIVERFWRERSGDFIIVPLFGYGGVPRRELCTQQSLVDALQSVTIEPGSFTEMKWKELCQQMSVAWPKRLTKEAA